MGRVKDDKEIFAQFGDLFSEFFEMNGKGADRRIPLTLSLEEAASGANKVIQATHGVRCARCKGDGGEPGSVGHTCYACHGTGQTQKAGEALRTCERCEGKRKIELIPCAVCRGKRLVPRERTLTVKVPAGIEDGQVIRLPDQGDEAPRGAQRSPGHLFLEVLVTPHPRLRREGAVVDIRVDSETARRGGRVRVPVLGGERTIAVPKGTESGAQVRLRGHGAVRLGADPVPLPEAPETPYRSVDAGEHRGDQIVTFLVEEGAESDADDAEEWRRSRGRARLGWALGLAVALAGAVLGALAGGR
jgi:DnaJ-class molecular chaperone